jgi:hypothetical protein
MEENMRISYKNHSLSYNPRRILLVLGFLLVIWAALMPVADVSGQCSESDPYYLDKDFDKNCYIDLLDMRIFAASWLKCTDPANSNCVEYMVPPGSASVPVPTKMRVEMTDASLFAFEFE